MDYNNIISTIAIVISLLGAIVQIINHRKVRSRCCHHVGEVSLDITSTTPEPQKT